jgi:Ca2+-binding EF-hand superfamily protein
MSSSTAAATAFQGRQMEYTNLHHLTKIPASIAQWQNKSNTLQNIEDNLHMKMSAACISDKQLFQYIHRMFKDQYVRAGKAKNEVTGIDKDDFYQILTLFGLFATRKQSDELFDKYDTNGSNNLSIHEFWVQARPRDYKTLPGFGDKQKQDEMVMGRARKRMYIKESLLNIPVKLSHPQPSVYSLPIERMHEGIRDKIRQRSVVDSTLSNTRTRRYLQKLFEYKDEALEGYVTVDALQMVLEHINYAVGKYYTEMLVKHYPGPHPGTVDYKSLCQAVYPTETNVRTSGYVGTQHVRRIPPKAVGAFGSMTARAPSRAATPVWSASRAPSRAYSRPGSRAAYVANAATQALYD